MVIIDYSTDYLGMINKRMIYKYIGKTGPRKRNIHAKNVAKVGWENKNMENQYLN